jgi:hypothetical protein
MVTFGTFLDINVLNGGTTVLVWLVYMAVCTEVKTYHCIPPSWADLGPGSANVASLILKAWFQARLWMRRPFAYSFAALAETDTCIYGYGVGHRYGRLGVPGLATVFCSPQFCLFLLVDADACLIKTVVQHCQVLHHYKVRQEAGVVGWWTALGAHVKMVKGDIRCTMVKECPNGDQGSAKPCGQRLAPTTKRTWGIQDRSNRKPK